MLALTNVVPRWDSFTHADYTVRRPARRRDAEDAQGRISVDSARCVPRGLQAESTSALLVNVPHQVIIVRRIVIPLVL